jgi:4-amino-4-deoxy-L-arabinose transferase-like glycosyltransferase
VQGVTANACKKATCWALRITVAYARMLGRAVTIRRGPIILLLAFSQFVLLRAFPWPKWLPIPAKYADADIYIQAGQALAHGALADSVNPEHPPLAKYVIGAFSIYLGNPYASAFVFGLLTAVMAFLIAGRFTKSLQWRALTVWILAVDQVNVSLSTRPMLDIFMVFFGVLGLYLLMIADSRDVKYVFAGVSFGFALACKLTAIFFIFPALILLLYRRELKRGVALLGTAAIGYTASYLQLLLIEGGPGFLRSQTWMLSFLYERHVQSEFVNLIERALTPIFFHLSTLAPVTGYVNCPPNVLGLPIASMAETVNAPLMILLFPVLIWLVRHRAPQSPENQTTISLFVMTIISWMVYEMVFPTAIGVWYSAPIGTLIAIAAPATLADLEQRGYLLGYLTIIWLALLSTWIIWANAIYMACGVA